MIKLTTWWQQVSRLNKVPNDRHGAAGETTVAKNSSLKPTGKFDFKLS